MTLPSDVVSRWRMVIGWGGAQQFVVYSLGYTFVGFGVAEETGIPHPLCTLVQYKISQTFIVVSSCLSKLEGNTKSSERIM